MQYSRYTLSNGLRVILVPIQEVGSATTLIMVGAGSRYEDKSNNGISHFLEHMAFKGTKKRPSAREIASLIDGIGAEQNAFTGKELTGYYIKSSYQHVSLSLDVMSDMLKNSLFDEREIEKEKGVILEEINLYEDTPPRKIGDIFENLLYGDTPMGWDIAGEKEIIKKITREDFMLYMKKLYSASNMTIVVAGKLDMDNVRRDIEKNFSDLPQFTSAAYAKVPDAQDKNAVFLKYKKTEQAHFGLGIRTVGLSDEKHKYPISVLAAILGGGMSSRLFHEVRESRGLAYYVRTYADNYVDRGYMATFAGVDPKRIDEAISVVVEEYHKIKKTGDISQEEFKKAKEYLKGHFILELEDTKSLASYFASDELLENKIETPEEVLEKIEKVTLSNVEDAAETFLDTQRLNLAIIGDYGDQVRFEKLLA